MFSFTENTCLACYGVFIAVRFCNALLKNAPPERFYLALLGTVAFEPLSANQKNKDTLLGVLQTVEKPEIQANWISGFCV